MNQPYFSERELGPRPRTEEIIDEAVWGGIVSLIERRLADNSFANTFPAQCPDSHVTCGVNAEAFSQAVRAEMPGISWPPRRGSVPDTLAILDLIEFCQKSIAKPIPIPGGWHGFFQHHHVQFDEEEGKQSFRDDVNRIFSRNGLAYELTAGGEIRRLGPEILRQALGATLFQTGDGELDRMLESARTKFLDPDLAVRKDAMEKLWDAWERLKTLEISGEGKKKASADQLLRKASAGDSKVLEVLRGEAEALTRVGNDFQIRHSETYKTPLRRSEHVDYLFHCMFSLITVLLRMTGRGG